MAEMKKVVRLDQKLIETGIIDPAYEKDYKTVHTMLNTHVKKNGKILTDDTFKKGDEALRKWLMLLYKKGASQEKLTSYLRCGLAHLSFDFIESGFSKIELDDLIGRALKSFKNRNYHKSFFRVSPAEMKELTKRKNEAKKKSVKKAAATKKTKPAAKAVRKTAVKKTAVKKAAVKKTAVKKAAAAKTPAKKTPAKIKLKSKKPAANKKKTAAKKPSPKVDKIRQIFTELFK